MVPVVVGRAGSLFGELFEPVWPSRLSFCQLLIIMTIVDAAAASGPAVAFRPSLSKTSTGREGLGFLWLPESLLFGRKLF